MLRLNFLGTFSLDYAKAVTISNRKAQGLLALLALAPPHSCSRERLATLLCLTTRKELRAKVCASV